MSDAGPAFQSPLIRPGGWMKLRSLSADGELPLSGGGPQWQVREDRSIGSAQEFFRQAVKVKGSPWPEKINLDGNAASHLCLRLLGEEDSRWQHVTVRARRYLFRSCPRPAGTGIT